MNVLLAEDDELVREMLTATLEALGHQVLAVADADEAAGEMKRSRPDLLVTDIRMPGRTGVDLVSEARKRDAGLPILVISGGGDHAPGGNLDDALRAGASAVLAKPFGARKLARAVAEAIAVGGRPVVVPMRTARS